MDARSCAGTLFGGYNAIVEHEDHMRAEPNLSILAGERARVKGKAYSFALGMLSGRSEINLN